MSASTIVVYFISADQGGLSMFDEEQEFGLVSPSAPSAVSAPYQRAMSIDVAHSIATLPRVQFDQAVFE